MQGLSRQFHNLLFIGGSVFWVDDSRPGTVFIRHSVFVCHSGSLLLHYEKKNDCAELNAFETVPNMAYVFQPGQTDGIFTCQGLQCGIETCVDHGFGQLRRDGARLLDLHIVISNVITIQARSVVTKGNGYVLHCNAGPFGCRVYQDPFDNRGEVNGATAGIGYVSRDNNRMALLSVPWPARPPLVRGGGLRIVA